MSRYIDADNLHNAKFQNTDGYGENVAYRLGWNEAIEAIEENEPTAIDIVRCKECKYEPICNHSVQHTTHDAYSVTIGSKTVEWCSYGERREP